MRIAVLGVGSIGGVVLGALSDSQMDLLAVARGQTAKNLSDIGLILHTPEGSIEMIPSERFIIVDSETPLSESIQSSCDIALICGKAASTPVLAQLAEEMLTPDGLAISLQNGLGNSEILANRIGRDRVLGGSITHGAWRDGDGSVYWVGRGAIRMGGLDGGPASGIASELFAALSDAQLEPIWSEDVQQIVWRKLLLNVAINPVCAIAGVRNGAILEVPELWEQSLAAMSEAASVARGLGVNLGEVELEDHLRKVVEATSENRCSMLQDVMAGRLTEIDSLCGAVVERGEILGIPTPANQALHAMVKGIEKSSEFA
ncbi:MAG: 2-dehydropantoate 2-reductase [Candidatus Thalassarchaeaceae archaeon]|nr:2-dehydropantoate 2-reductase [Candidatus Thalassarchaeaceae archaeon]DAC35302.1 MAG TPA: 2-dehydropantoate 2-reductase [Candidatus Poseidoniales archaeon]HIH80118.1 2-dehydropantoate 2-reductase [Candidatus Thalassarchaeaceae archaeon]|tara:strand:+ start:2562 stop:3512 length:951 start_codon:yes stop_codon:yes gene_type:complete